MPVSEKNRKRFEGIGLEMIRRELTVGNVYYLPLDAAAQAEALPGITINAVVQSASLFGGAIACCQWRFRNVFSRGQHGIKVLDNFFVDREAIVSS
jgi:hypothetical protein